MGGAQTYLWHLLQHAKEGGHTVSVMADKPGWLSEKTIQLGFSFIPNPYFKNSFNPLSAIFGLIETRKIIKKLRPDIMHANSGAGGFFGRLASIGTGTKIIFTAHGWSFTPGTPFLRRIAALAMEQILSFITDEIICVSNNDARLARRCLFGVSKKIHVIHNGVPIPQQVASLGTSDKIHLIFVGRLTRPKLPIVILRALGGLPVSMRENFRLRIVGDGPQKEKLLMRTKEMNLETQVVIASEKMENMNELYLTSDLLVLPTEWEGFPITIIEAMALGVPVVASAVGGIPEAVDETVGTLLVRGNEAEELKKVFERLAHNTWLLVEKGKNARARAVAQFSSKTMCDSVWKLYASF